MSTSLNFKAQKSGGAYGTHPSSGSNSSSNSINDVCRQTASRRRNNPSEYGPFSSPHASFDDPLSFPPYAELPFTALKRRRKLQEGNSFVKWAMRGVLLSPVIVLTLWSIVAMVVTNSHHGNYGSKVSNSKQQSRRGIKRIFPNFMSTVSQAVQSPIVYMQSQQNTGNSMLLVASPQRQQTQPPENNDMAMAASPRLTQTQAMMLVSPRRQQAQSQENNGMMMVVSPQHQQAQSQGTNGLMVSAQRKEAQPQETNSMMMVVSPQRQQSQASGQVPDQHYMATSSVAQVNPEQFMQTQFQQDGIIQEAKRIPVVAPLGSSELQQSILDQVYMVSGQIQDPLQQQEPGSRGAGRLVIASRPHPRATFDDTSLGQAVNKNPVIPNEMSVVTMQHQQPQKLDDQQSSHVKQSVYYYDPKDTSLSDNGDILQLPNIVYDVHGRATPISKIQQAQIYVQPPMLGSTNSNAMELSASVLSNVADGLEQEVPVRQAVQLPQWGASTSQDRTVIVATVAVMALLVGALSARRLRSKSFLSSCIENETLEDDLSYDSAYTTPGISGANLSYNTFGGWKGDLEKFDV